MEKKRKKEREASGKKTKERKGKKEGGEASTRPWHTFLAVPFKNHPFDCVFFFLKKKKKKSQTEGKKFEKEQA
jgi:hypothetical protein